MVSKQSLIRIFIACVALCLPSLGRAQSAASYLPLRAIFFDYARGQAQVLIDTQTASPLPFSVLEEASRASLQFFFIGLAVPNDAFWVNLRPDSPEQMLDPRLSSTDIGRILLEADVSLKKDTAQLLSAESSAGRVYWENVYRKASEIFGSFSGDRATIPTMIRPWIVPDELLLSESGNSVYLVKATLKVLLQEDHLKNGEMREFSDPRYRELNEYACEQARALILPELTRKVNSDPGYAQLRQVYHALVMAQWYKRRHVSAADGYGDFVDKGDVSTLSSAHSWDPREYFEQYRRSFSGGETSGRVTVDLPQGRAVRTIVTGGASFTGIPVPDPGHALEGAAAVPSLDPAAGFDPVPEEHAALEVQIPHPGEIGEVAPAASHPLRAAGVWIEGDMVTIEVEGRRWLFRVVHFPAGDHREGIQLFAPSDTEKKNVLFMMYNLRPQPGSSESGLNGIWLQEGLRGHGMMRSLLSLYYSLYPHLRTTNPTSNNIMLQHFLLRYYGYAPRDAQAAPTAWFRFTPGTQPAAEDIAGAGTGVSYQVIFATPELEAAFRKWEGSTAYKILEKGSVPDEEMASFSPVYYGSTLEVKDERAFSTGLASASVHQGAAPSVSALLSPEQIMQVQSIAEMATELRSRIAAASNPREAMRILEQVDRLTAQVRRYAGNPVVAVFLARWTFSREESLDIMNDMVQVYTLAQLWQLKDVQTQFREAAPFAVQQLTRMLEVLNRSIEMAGRGQGIPLKYEAYAGNPGLTRFADIDQILGDTPGSQPGTSQDGPGSQGGVPSGGVPFRGVPEVGGVDFTAMPMVVQALERVRALPAVSPDPALSSEDVSLEQEQLSGLIRAGIQVSAQRAAEHVQQVMGMPSMRPAALQLLRSILRQDERLSRPSDQRLKDLFVIFESSALP